MIESEIAENQWFEGWFNSPYYHLLYSNRNEDEARNFIDRLMNHLNLPSGSRILDLACGAGRHSIHMHSKGYDVVGIDLSEESILAASKSATDKLEFYEHDMRLLYWSDHFNLVVNLFTSFGYFHSKEDDLKMLQGVFDGLKPEGRFVIDFMNAKKVIRDLVFDEEKEIDGVQFKISRKVENGIIIKAIEVSDGLISQQFSEEVDGLMLPDFEDRFDEIGFKIEDVFGDYDLNKFDEDTSDRLIMIVSKAV
jgi:SAM-dependent methyltransferase